MERLLTDMKTSEFVAAYDLWKAEAETQRQKYLHSQLDEQLRFWRKSQWRSEWQMRLRDLLDIDYESYGVDTLGHLKKDLGELDLEYLPTPTVFLRLKLNATTTSYRRLKRERFIDASFRSWKDTNALNYIRIGAKHGIRDPGRTREKDPLECLSEETLSDLYAEARLHDELTYKGGIKWGTASSSFAVWSTHLALLYAENSLYHEERKVDWRGHYRCPEKFIEHCVRRINGEFLSIRRQNKLVLELKDAEALM